MTIVVCEGIDDDGRTMKEVQILVRKNCNYLWVTSNNNPTEIPNSLPKLRYPVFQGAFGPEH